MLQNKRHFFIFGDVLKVNKEQNGIHECVKMGGHMKDECLFLQMHVINVNYITKKQKLKTTENEQQCNSQ